MALPLISIVIPLKNEATNITPLYHALHTITLQLNEFAFELLFIDDGSTDRSVAIIEQLQTNDSTIRLIRLTRNFGKEMATSAGLHAAQGEAAIMIDADLQHPPELIPEFIARWQAGDDVVIGRQQLNASYASLTKRFTSRWFYRLINSISTVKIIPHATDFRLLDRAVINEFNRFTEHQRLTRGLIDWLGFSPTYVNFTPAKRLNGSRSYNYRQLIKLATDSIVSSSFFPLRIAGYLGMLIVLVSTPLIVFILFDRLFKHNSFNFTGSATLAAMLLFLIGIVLICLGLMALYIANIYAEVLNRPLYVEKRPRSKR